MLESHKKGYAVMSPDLTAIAFEDESLENCKRYCFNGDVIVAVTPKKCGFSIRCRFHRKNEWFKWTKWGDRVFFKTRFYFDWEYTHEYGKEILWTNPYGYSESVKKGLIK